MFEALVLHKSDFASNLARGNHQPRGFDSRYRGSTRGRLRTDSWQVLWLGNHPTSGEGANMTSSSVQPLVARGNPTKTAFREYNAQRKELL